MELNILKMKKGKSKIDFKNLYIKIESANSIEL
jgi:hypothetical protein